MSVAENSRDIEIKTRVKISIIARYSNYTVVRAFRADYRVSYRRIIGLPSTGREYHNRGKNQRLASFLEIGELEADICRGCCSSDCEDFRTDAKRVHVIRTSYFTISKIIVSLNIPTIIVLYVSYR